MAATEKKTQLPATAYAVLGMLTFGEMSGYDLGKAIEGSIGFFWTPAKSQIYSELRRLREVGYANEREVEQTDRPDKRLYSITPEGMQALKEWLENEPIDLEPIKSVFLLKVFFGHLQDPRAVIAQVEAYRGQMRGLLARFREIDRHIRQEGGLPYPHLTLKYGIAYAKAALAWCGQTLQELNEAAKGGAR